MVLSGATIARKPRVSGSQGKSGRVVEGTGLENQQRCKPFVGSNPTSSANAFPILKGRVALYPTRIWTKFESDQFRERFGRNEVIPIRFTTVVPGFFTEDAKYGGVAFDPNGDVDAQVAVIADVLCARLIDDRAKSQAAEAEEAVAVAVAVA